VTVHETLVFQRNQAWLEVENLRVALAAKDAEIERLRKIEAAVHAFCDELQVLAAPPVQEKPCQDS
jgi:hypothetical protein